MKELNKNNNLKKLELIKNDIEILKDPSKKAKIIDEEEKINMEKEIERKNELKLNKKIYHEKMEEYDKLKQNLQKLNNELMAEKEGCEQIELNLKENNEILNKKINEGNEIEIKFEELKKERNLLLEQLFGDVNIKQ